MKYQEIATVVSASKPASEHIVLHLKSPKIAKTAKPGQFVMALCGNSTDPLLRRPISFHDIDRKRSIVTLMFKVLGNGTRYLSMLKKGDKLDLIGPLGNTFSIASARSTPVLIGGGAGIAPLLPLGRTYKKRAIVIIGTNTRSAMLAEEEFKASGCRVMVTTDDGTSGVKGTVLDALKTIKEKDLKIFACGPRPMIKTLQFYCASRNIDCEVSLEEWMACGIGACYGCTVETRKGYKKVCSDGPVFDIKELI